MFAVINLGFTFVYWLLLSENLSENLNKLQY